MIFGCPSTVAQHGTTIAEKPGARAWWIWGPQMLPSHFPLRTDVQKFSFSMHSFPSKFAMNGTWIARSIPFGNNCIACLAVISPCAGKTISHVLSAFWSSIVIRLTSDQILCGLLCNMCIYVYKTMFNLIVKSSINGPWLPYKSVKWLQGILVAFLWDFGVADCLWCTSCFDPFFPVNKMTETES